MVAASPADDGNDAVVETNNLCDVMAAAAVIGIGGRFSLGKPAGKTSTLIDIVVEYQGLYGMPSNAIPRRGDTRATIQAFTPRWPAADAGNHTLPDPSVDAAGRFWACRDAHPREQHISVIEVIQTGHRQGAYIVWDAIRFGFCARAHRQVRHSKPECTDGTGSRWSDW